MTLVGADIGVERRLQQLPHAGAKQYIAVEDGGDLILAPADDPVIQRSIPMPAVGLDRPEEGSRGDGIAAPGTAANYDQALIDFIGLPIEWRE